MVTGPASIGRFGRLWLASTLAWGMATTLSWTRLRHALEADRQAAVLAAVALPVWVAVVLLVTAGLWYGAAVRASRVAKWLIVVVALCSALRGVAALLSLAGTGRYPWTAGATMLSAVLAVLAAAALFRDDAAAWFGELHDADDVEGRHLEDRDPEDRHMEHRR